MTSRKNAADTRGKPFAKGNAGRPRGSRNKATMVAELLLDGEAETITRKAIELAKGGDITAIRLCLERILPPRKDRPIAVDLPTVSSVGDLKAVYAVVVRDVATGELTPDQGRAFSDLLESYRRTIETSEIEQRMVALEESMMSGSKRAPG